MRLIHLLSISSLVWLLYCMYGSYVYILYLFEKIFFSFKIIDKQHFPYIFRPLRYFGGVTLMNFNHLSLISS